jgi:hypothetical protein
MQIYYTTKAAGTFKWCFFVVQGKTAQDQMCVVAKDGHQICGHKNIKNLCSQVIICCIDFVAKNVHELAFMLCCIHCVARFGFLSYFCGMHYDGREFGMDAKVLLIPY